jgi:hypothetical protein
MITVMSQCKKSYGILVIVRPYPYHFNTYSSCGRIEGLVASPEARPWEKAFLCELLIETAVSERDRKHVTEIA